jgi:3-phosphoshikimate 1-carboxyvinyltransferase
MKALVIQPVVRPVVGTAHIPGSKSITNRALLLAALAQGESRIEGSLFSDDTRYMAAALERLGIQIAADEDGGVYVVHGTGGHIPTDHADLYVGNAGTAARFLTAYVALGKGVYRMDGVPRMRQRPIRDLLETLHQLGIDAKSEQGTGCLPVVIRANGLPGGEATLDASHSSQFLSAILLVAPLSAHGIKLTVIGDPVSQPYIDMTLRMMQQWGATWQSREGGYFVPGNQTYRAQTYRVEPDASSASYFFAAAAVTGGRVRVEGLGRNSLQGDVDFVNVLGSMGCSVTKADSYIEVSGCDRLRGVEVDMNGISDTVMTLAAIAPFASSPTTIHNIAHIRHKESDRLHALATELRRLGVTVEERDDGLVIHPAATLKPAEIETYDDHRIAMAFAITGLRSPGIAIKDPDCVSKTFPNFFRHLQSLCDNSI